MNKIMRIIRRVTLVMVAILIGLLAISTITNAIMTRAEKKQYPDPGVLVNVHGKKMHVYTKRTGAKKLFFSAVWEHLARHGTLDI